MAVIKHNSKLKRRAAESVAAKPADVKARKRKGVDKDPTPIGAPINTSIEHSNGPADIGQDQGFVPPRILVLCPFRSTARKFVLGLKAALGANTTISSAAKFDQEFGYEDDDEEDEINSEDSAEDASIDGDSGTKNVKRGKNALPKDWQMLFRDNIDDDFKFGIQVNPGQGKGAGADKGVYMRMYSDFYASDIIVASPLGLKLIVDTSNGKLNFDFLSSIELVLLHQADVMYMQNWEHVDYILSKINGMPLTDHGTDFSRVRPYFLEGSAARHRQVVFTTEFNSPGTLAWLICLKFWF